MSGADETTRIGKSELGKIDPKCWLCGSFVKPLVVRYQPLICEDCRPAYQERKYVWIRWTTEDIAEMFPECRSILETGGN